MKIAALLAVAALAGPAAKSSTPRLDAFVLLGNGRIVKLDVASGRIAVRRVLGTTPRVLPEHGDMLVVDGSRVYALVPTRPQTLVVTDRALRVKSKTRLPASVVYRGVVRADGTTYAFGYRPGRIIDPGSGERESDAVVTRIEPGEPVQSSTTRKANGQDWWEFSGAVSTDGARLALSYHGSTSGADLIDLSLPELHPGCAVDSPGVYLGCYPQVHGVIRAYGNGWLATTGGQQLVRLDWKGEWMGEIDSGFRNEHLMSLAVDARRGVAFSLATCYYGREGLRTISIDAASSRLVRRAPCGNDLSLGPGATLLAVESADASAGTSVIALSRSTGRVLHRWRLSGYVVAVAGA